MKTIQEKIAELEIRTSSLEKKSSFLKHLSEIAEWIQSQPGVQIIKSKQELIKDIDWLLTKYRAVSLTDFYHVYSASNKANTLEIDFTRNPKNVNFVRLIYSKTTGDIEIKRKRKPNKPRGGLVNKTPQEVAALVIDWGIGDWYQSLNQTELIDTQDKKYRAMGLLAITYLKLRKKYNDLPKQMDNAFKKQVVEILVDKLPDVGDGRYLPGNKGKSKIKTYLDL